MIFILDINNGQMYDNSQYPFMEWTAGVSLNLSNLIKKGVEESENRNSTSFIIHVWEQDANEAKTSVDFFKNEVGVWTTLHPYVRKYLVKGE